MSAEKLPPDGYEPGPGWMVAGLRGGSGYVSGKGQVVGPDDAEAAGAIVRKAEAPTVIGSDWRCACGKANWAMHSSCIACGVAPPEQPSGNPGELPPEAPAGWKCKHCRATMSGAHLADENCPVCWTKKGAEPPATYELRKPPEAPAAPFGEPSEARHLAHAFVTANRLDCEKERPSPEPRPEHFPLCDRLTDVIQRAIDPRAARIAALEAEVAEAKSERDQWKHAHGEAYKVAVGAAAAVQAERERCAATLDEWLAGRIERLSECRQRIGDGTPIKNGDPAP